MEKEQQVLDEMNHGKRDSQNALGGQMCHMLSNESASLKVENASLRAKLEFEASEVRQLKRASRDLEEERKKLLEKLEIRKESDKVINDLIASEQWVFKKPEEFATRSVLRGMISDLNIECGK